MKWLKRVTEVPSRVLGFVHKMYINHPFVLGAILMIIGLLGKEIDNKGLEVFAIAGLVIFMGQFQDLFEYASNRELRIAYLLGYLGCVACILAVIYSVLSRVNPLFNVWSLGASTGGGLAVIGALGFALLHKMRKRTIGGNDDTEKSPQ